MQHNAAALFHEESLDLQAADQICVEGFYENGVIIAKVPHVTKYD
jgi:hypothetical protein